MRCLAGLLMILSTPVLSAESDDPLPPGLQRALGRPPEVTLAPARPAAAAPEKEGPRPTKIGEHRLLDAAQLAKGKWVKKSKDAPAVWHLAIKSNGAAAMRVHFREFRAGAGGKAWVHNGKEWHGPYTGGGLYGDGDFWSHVVPGDRLIIEFAGPPGSKQPGIPPFSVREISHLTTNPLE